MNPAYGLATNPYQTDDNRWADYEVNAPAVLAQKKAAADAAVAQKAQTDAARKAGIQSRLDQLRGQVGQVKPSVMGMEGPAQAGEYQGQRSAVGQAYQAKKITGPLAEYDAIRSRIGSQANQANQTAQDALARRFAAMGALNSGAAIKQQQLQSESSERSKADQLQNVDFQEAQARRELEQGESQKEFQSQEALKGREMAAEESYQGRKFTTEQRNFEAQQQVLQRNMQRELFNADSQFKADVFKFDSNSKLNSLDLAWEGQELDRENTQYNKEQNEWTRKHTGGLFGSGGFLGLGIGVQD
jgi:hypothetical protein